jgi:NADH:ubiquinone oxidoreductase subunit K
MPQTSLPESERYRLKLFKIVRQCTLLILITSFELNDNSGQTFSIYIISIAGAESIIGLSIIVAYYKLRGNLLLKI